MPFKFKLDDNIMYEIKDAVMVQFLKDDVDSIKQNLAEGSHPVDHKYDKKLLKAYRTILAYYGEHDV